MFSSVGLRQSILMLGGNATAQGVSAISLIIISRSLGPELFGEFSVGFAIALMLNRISDLGLSFAIQKYAPVATDNGQVNRIFSFTLRMKLIANLILMALGIITYSWIAKLLNFDNPSIILISFLFFGATVMYEQLQAMLQSLHHFIQSVGVNLLQAVTKLIGIAGLWYLGLKSANTMLTWYMLAPLAPVILFSKFMPRWTEIKIFKQDFSGEQTLLSTMASHTAVAFIAAGIIENIDVLFVQRYLTTYETGLFGGASRIALLLALAAYSLSNVLNPRVAKYQTKADIAAYLKKAVMIAVASVIGFLLFLPFSGMIINLTIGPAYADGQLILNILMAASFLTVAVVPFMALFFSFDAPWYFSVTGIMQLLVIVLGNVIFVPMFGLEAAAWTRLASRMIFLVVTVCLAAYYYRRKMNTETEEVEIITN